MAGRSIFVPTRLQVTDQAYVQHLLEVALTHRSALQRLPSSEFVDKAQRAAGVFIRSLEQLEEALKS